MLVALAALALSQASPTPPQKGFLLSDPRAGDPDACTLFAAPGSVYTGGNVIGFSTVATSDACCAACAAASACQFYSYKASSKGCTQYSTTTGTAGGLVGDGRGTKAPPPPPPAPLPGKPDDSPCVKWLPYDNHKPITNQDDFVTSIKTTVLGACTPNCYCAATIGDVFPCFVSDPGTDVFGHHDYLPPGHAAGLCISQTSGGARVFGRQQFMAGKGDHPDGFSWQLTQMGATAPSNAVTAGGVNGRALGRSVQNVPNPGCGHGYTGWIQLTGGKLGPLQYAVASGAQNSTGTFEIAVCEACLPCPKIYNASFHPGAGCPNCTKPIHPPPPPPPLSTNPCIRFGHAIPVDNHGTSTPYNLNTVVIGFQLELSTNSWLTVTLCRSRRYDRAGGRPHHHAHMEQLQVQRFLRRAHPITPPILSCPAL